MFKRLVQTLKNLSANRPPFNPERFNDPIAEKTEWIPLKRGGTNIKTHNLVMVDPNRYEFKPAVGAIIFYLFFLLIGLGLAGFMIYQIDFNYIGEIDAGIIVAVIMGLIFLVVGFFLFRNGTKPIVFDKSNGFYWKGRQNPSQVYDQNIQKNMVQLYQVHALQIIREYVRGNKSSYYSYELNLILKDGSRKNVVDHGSIKQLQKDAQTLGQFLGIPVWDAGNFV
jgi:hypothetical protein